MPAGPARRPVTDVVADLLYSAEQLPFPERMRVLALRARQLDAYGKLTDVLRELEARGHYERRIALHMAMAARDLGFIERTLAGPDLELRRAALRAVRLLPVRDEAIPPALADAPAALRKAVYRTLLHSRRAGLAAEMLPGTQHRWGDREAALLLPACDEETVQRWLPDLAHAVTSWGQFARRHPGSVLSAMDRELRDGIFPGTVLRRYRGVITWIAARDPGSVLRLSQRHEHFAVFAPHLPDTALASLLHADVAGATRIFKGQARWDWPLPAMLPHLRQWSDDDIIRTFGGPGSARLGSLLAALPPSRRAAIFAGFTQHPSSGLGQFGAMSLLDALPRDTAAAEARRMLDWHASTWHSSRAHLDNPDIPLRLTAYLPYAQAAAALREAARSGDAHRRGLARDLMLGCAARTGDADVFADVLAELAERVVNEQDPLRESLLSALCKVRPALLTGACVPALDRLSESATAARDCSGGTRRTLTRLACRVLRHTETTGPAAERTGQAELVAWGIGVFAKLASRFGADGFSGPGQEQPEELWSGRRRPRRRAAKNPRAQAPAWLARSLRHRQEHALLETLRATLEAARARQDFRFAVALATALGPRAAQLPELQADLHRAAVSADEQVAAEATAQWLAHAPDRDARATALIRENPARLRLPEVWRAIAGRRTHLLPTVLRQCPPAADWTPAISEGQAGRWTPRQREHVRDLLAAQVRDPGVPTAQRALAVMSASRIPGRLTAMLVTEWASTDDITIAEAALAGLPRAERPDAALRLLTARTDDLSRAVTTVLGRCAELVPPSALEPILEQALFGADVKVTTRKQAARLLGRHRTTGAADLLLRAWQAPDLHRDVRVAVASALRRMPDDPRTFTALQDAAGTYASEFMLRTLFQATPVEYRPATRPAYAALIRDLLTAADGPGVRFRAGQAFSTWAKWYAGGFGDLLEEAADPDNPAGETSLQVLTSLLGNGIVTDDLIGVLEHLAALPADLSHPESAAMRRLPKITQAMIHVAERHPHDDWPAVLGRRAIACLRADPRYLGHATRIAQALLVRRFSHGSTLPTEAIIAELDTIADLIGDRPVLAARTAHDITRRLTGNYADRSLLKVQVLLEVVQHLVRKTDTFSGFLACALLKRGGAVAGWTSQWTAFLPVIRQSSHDEVRRQAWETLVER
jgi:hypothetical protein